MRLALYHNLPPGGALRSVAEFVRRRSTDIDLDVFVLDFGDLTEFPHAAHDANLRSVAEGASSHRSVTVDVAPWGRALDGRLRRVGMLGAVRRAERSVAALINQGHYDVAMVHPCWFSQTPSLLCDLELPSVYYMHEVRRATFEQDYAARPPLRRLPGALVARTVDRVLAGRDVEAARCPTRILTNSAHTLGTITAAYGRTAHVCYLGVDEEAFSPCPAGRPAPGAPGVVSVGGLERFKGHHLVIDALSTVREDLRPDLHVVYERCDTAYRDELRAQAQRLRVRLVEHERVPDAELVRILRTSVATVLAAQNEPFGLVALESMAVGTPVVAVREGGYLETVEDGVNGYLVPRTPAGIRDGVVRVLDGDLRRTPDEIRRTVIPGWSWDDAVRRQEAHLRELAGDQP